KEWLKKMIATLQERAKTLVELVDAAHYYLSDEITPDEKAVKKFLTAEAAAQLDRQARGARRIHRSGDRAGLHRDFERARPGHGQARAARARRAHRRHGEPRHSRRDRRARQRAHAQAPAPGPGKHPAT